MQLIAFNFYGKVSWLHGIRSTKSIVGMDFTAENPSIDQTRLCPTENVDNHFRFVLNMTVGQAQKKRFIIQKGLFFINFRVSDFRTRQLD